MKLMCMRNINNGKTRQPFGVALRDEPRLSILFEPFCDFLRFASVSREDEFPTLWFFNWLRGDRGL